MINDGGKGNAVYLSSDHVPQLDRGEHVVEIRERGEMCAEEHEQAARENAPSANCHQGDHRQPINADLQHLAHGCLTPMTVPYKWQRVAHRAQRRPQLNVQTPDVVEFTDGPFSDVFENSCHQDTFDAEEILVQPLISNRANTPVTSNR